MRTKNIVAALTLVVLGVVFGAVLVSGFGWVRPGFADVRIGSQEAPVQDINPELLSFNNAFIEVAEKVTPSIVQIRVISKVNKSDNSRDPFHFFMPFRDDIPKEQQGSGSGVIISEDGYILTNNHVVENASHVTVDMLDRTSYDAEVIGTDPLTDLAVIKIDGEELEFTKGFTDLHTVVYEKIINGTGFGIDDARPSIELVHKIRNDKVVDSNKEKKHFLLIQR